MLIIKQKVKENKKGRGRKGKSRKKSGRRVYLDGWMAMPWPPKRQRWRCIELGQLEQRQPSRRGLGVIRDAFAVKVELLVTEGPGETFFSLFTAHHRPPPPSITTATSSRTACCWAQVHGTILHAFPTTKFNFFFVCLLAYNCNIMIASVTH